ncbi:MAG: hypothetical protein EOP04_08810, partial [Proteobacteria bacterium]
MTMRPKTVDTNFLNPLKWEVQLIERISKDLPDFDRNDYIDDVKRQVTSWKEVIKNLLRGKDVKDKIPKDEELMVH